MNCFNPIMGDFSQYKIISDKLKKRFLLRKPNPNEVSEQFASLGRDLRDFKAYSAYCSLAVARCEHNMGNTPYELHALLESARLFSQSNQINAAVSSYRHALKACEPPMVAPINAELAKMYKNHKRFVEAAQSFIDGDLHKDAAECYLLAKHYEFALECYHQCQASQLTTNDSVTIFLLKLYLNDPAKCDFQLPVIECHPENDKLNDLNILLESLLISMRSKNDDESECRNSLVKQLFPRLNAFQNDLLYIIVTEKSF